jgi:hypothetical protein
LVVDIWGGALPDGMGAESLFGLDKEGLDLDAVCFWVYGGSCSWRAVFELFDEAFDGANEVGSGGVFHLVEKVGEG